MTSLGLVMGGAAADSVRAVPASYHGDAAAPAAGRPAVASGPSADQVTPVTPAAAVLPLRRIVPPDVLVVAEESVDTATLRRISRIRGVHDVVSFDGGSVRLRGRPVDVLGVRPAAFRGWTPPATAAADGLWTALAGDELVTSPEAHRDHALDVGGSYRIEGRTSSPVRLGAAAALGLPGIDALVSKRLGRRLGLVRDIGVLVNAPGTDVGELATALRGVFGTDAQVVPVREEPAQRLPTGPAPRGKARSYLELYRQAAARCPGLSWTVLAAIGQVESGHGRNNGPSSAGALGPMQFMPGTWRAYGVDGDGDGRADVMNPYDAVPAAAGYLCANGAGRGGAALWNAIWHYNHADWYVRDVLSLARAYARSYR